MRQYGRVSSQFWIDAKEKGLSDDGRQLMVYMMTCQHGNNIGCFRIPSAYIAEDLNWASERVTETLSETVSKGFLERDDNCLWNRLPNHFQTVSIENPNVAKGMEQFIDAVPKNSTVFSGLLASLQPFAGRFRKGYLNSLANPSERVTETLSGTVPKQSSCSCSSSLDNNKITSFFTNSAGEAENVDKPVDNYNNELNLNDSMLGGAVNKPVDGSDIDLNLNDFSVASVVVARAIRRKNLTACDTEILNSWLMTYDLKDILPFLEKRVANYLSKNGKLPNNPLSYFSLGLNEHFSKVGIK